MNIARKRLYLSLLIRLILLSPVFKFLLSGKSRISCGLQNCVICHCEKTFKARFSLFKIVPKFRIYLCEQISYFFLIVFCSFGFQYFIASNLDFFEAVVYPVKQPAIELISKEAVSNCYSNSGFPFFLFVS